MIAVVGVVDPSALSERARHLLGAADAVVGAPRLLRLIDPGATRTVPLSDLAPALDEVARIHDEGGIACVLASGDPGFFGIVRALAARFGRATLAVEPAASSVSVAFARLGMPWDDAVVVSAHGRPLAQAAAVAAASPKVAVLTGPESGPAALGSAVLALGGVHSHAAVCTALGSPDERVEMTDLAGLTTGTWDALSVVVLWSGDGVDSQPGGHWGRPVSAFVHRPGMITKPEVRSVVVGLLSPQGGACLWDVGAGSGSVGVECALAAPGLTVLAIDQDADAAALIIENARNLGAPVQVLTGAAPAVLAGLPDPDRVFVGGGGIEVLRAAWDRLVSGGVLVATHAAVDRAAVAADLLGNLSCITANAGRRLPDGGWRLEGANPVFVTWGRRP